MSELKLEIGGIGILITWEEENSPILNWPIPSYEKFVSNSKPKIKLKVRCARLPGHSSQLLFDCKKEGYWRLYQNHSKYIFEMFNTVTQKKNKVCFMNSDFCSGDVYVNPKTELLPFFKKLYNKKPGWIFASLMEPLSQLLILNILSQGQGVMVHGLGIKDQEKGIAFIGRSGAGKSTLASFWNGQKGAEVLSDEYIIIRKEKDKFFLYGTPWPGLAAITSPKKVRLNKIFFIEHSQGNKILGRGRVEDFLPQVFMPYWDNRRISVVLDFCDEMIKTIKPARLGFAKEERVVEFIRQHTKKDVII